MNGTSSPLLVYLSEEPDYDEAQSVENIEMSAQGHGGDEDDDDDDDDDDVDDIAEQFQCMSMTLHKREPTKRGEEPVQLDNYGVWRQEQKSRAAKLEKHLRALDDLIEEQLNRFHAHYSHPMVTTRLKDVVQLLVPKWASAHEMAAQAWFGDWRPSAILDLLRSLARSSPSSLSEPNDIEQALPDLIHEMRIEEVVLDEEMGEIQSTCILNLPFGMVDNRHNGPGSAMAFVRSEFNKIFGVITKAQNLRFKAWEMVVKKVLSRTDAAEFLVAFAGIQDSIHQAATQAKLRKGPVSLPVKALGSS
ncbi:uncharacterized protein LOC132267410 [Cornus florida]|uniref:uncharacterized protein LOC132267410 n=1 Tax=Cornus florida TaxID=4283 RepID=UPI0028A2886A|nr:uncharacterized protein LOC132267410 [Cornus florida]